MSVACWRIDGARRRAFSRTDLLVTACFLLGVVMILSPALAQVRARGREATCAENLHRIGMAMHIYANDSREWFPIHFFLGANTPPLSDPVDVDVHWVGTMGSSETLLVSEPTTRTNSPSDNHPSRSLFLLITRGVIEPEQFVCPNTRDVVDDLWNDGLDPYGPGEPGVNRFDFRGYFNLSYGYQLPYGRRGKPRETLESSMPICADKGPYYEGDGPLTGGTRTVHDRRSELDAPRGWVDLSVEEILGLTTEWHFYNSRAHGNAGQNVLLVDSSVVFAETPIVGVGYDNIYTITNSWTDPVESMIGVMPDADQAWGPQTQTDSFLVP